MSTNSLRDILHKARKRDLGFRVLLAEDAHGPGGGVFIVACTELDERHLAWLERRNLAPGAPTYVEVIFARDHLGTALPIELRAEGAAKSAEQHRRANELSRQVGQRAEDEVRQATQVHRLVGNELFTPDSTQNPKVRENLRELELRLQNFHGSVSAALDEYIAGNTLIMDLIAQFDPDIRAVTHGLNVAVLASEMAAPVLFEELGENTNSLKHDLVDVFVGGFLHDCGLWDDNADAEGHEAHTLNEAISRLSREADGSLYSRFLAALCNTQVRPIAPRRAYVALCGQIQLPNGRGLLDLDRFGGGSLLHGNDPYSPHIVLLSATNDNGTAKKLQYIDPRSPDFWARHSAPPQRFYLPAGRYKNALTISVTGFMSETVFSSILGEYEAALRTQTQV